MDSLKNVLVLMPSNLRLTIVDHDGKVLYDNSLDKEQEIENHLQRPEIQTALIQKTGTGILKVPESNTITLPKTT